MASTDVIIMNLLGIVSYAAGAYLAIKFVLPKVKIIAAEVLRYPKTTESLIYLLTILVYIITAQGIVGRVVAVGLPKGDYINVVNPAIDVLNQMVPVVRAVLIGIGAVLLVERIRLRS